jgi:isocitrate dehydrogenase (NAD+)
MPICARCGLSFPAVATRTSIWCRCGKTSKACTSVWSTISQWRISSGVNTRAGSRRIAEFAFDYALRHGRHKVTVVHEANILKALTGIFLEAAHEVGRRYEGRVAMDDRIVDACAMQLVLNPWQFDVIVTTNLFGDILSDEIAGLVGGLGLAPGASKGVANPVALMLAAGLMLGHVGRADLAGRLRAAMDLTLCEDRVRTADLGGTATTRRFAEAVARRVNG